MRLLERWRDWRLGPLTRDWCDVCHRPLRARERVEITSGSNAGVTKVGFGGSWVAATYCKSHAPGGDT